MSICWCFNSHSHKNHGTQESQRNKRIQSMEVLNLTRAFKLQKMKESMTIKKHSNRLFGIANKVIGH